MPQITVKTEYIKKLKELGVYDQWLENVKMQWEGTGCALNPTNSYYNAYRSNCITDTSFRMFIVFSFEWALTDEQGGFWHDIAHNKITIRYATNKD